MSGFLHKLAEGLRAREKMLEDHSEHPAFEAEGGDTFKAEYDALMDELTSFNKKVKDAHAKGGDYDEHFEKQIEGENQHLTVKIDTWAKNIPAQK